MVLSPEVNARVAFLNKELETNASLGRADKQAIFLEINRLAGQTDVVAMYTPRTTQGNTYNAATNTVTTPSGQTYASTGGTPTVASVVKATTTAPDINKTIQNFYGPSAQKQVESFYSPEAKIQSAMGTGDIQGYSGKLMSDAEYTKAKLLADVAGTTPPQQYGEYIQAVTPVGTAVIKAAQKEQISLLPPSQQFTAALPKAYEQVITQPKQQNIFEQLTNTVIDTASKGLDYYDTGVQKATSKIISFLEPATNYVKSTEVGRVGILTGQIIVGGTKRGLMEAQQINPKEEPIKFWAGKATEVGVGYITFLPSLVLKPKETLTGIGEFISTRPAAFKAAPLQTAAELSLMGLVGEGVGSLGKFGKESLKSSIIKIGAKERPAVDVFSSQVLSGTKNMPLTKSTAQSIELFKKSATKVDDALGNKNLYATHATPSFPKGKEVPIIAGPKAKAFMEDPGLFVTPAGEGSPYFLGIEKGGGYKFSLNPLKKAEAAAKPQVIEIAFKEIKTLPKAELTKPGFVPVGEYFKKVGGSESAVYITKRSTIGQGEIAAQRYTVPETYVSPLSGKTIPKGAILKTAGTSELEGVVPLGSTIVKVKPTTFLGRLKGFEEYTTYQGRAVPIKKYTIKETATSVVDDITSSKPISLTKTKVTPYDISTIYSYKPSPTIITPYPSIAASFRIGKINTPKITTSFTSSSKMRIPQTSAISIPKIRPSEAYSVRKVSSQSYSIPPKTTYSSLSRQITSSRISKPTSAISYRPTSSRLSYPKSIVSSYKPRVSSYPKPTVSSYKPTYSKTSVEPYYYSSSSKKKKPSYYPYYPTKVSRPSYPTPRPPEEKKSSILPSSKSSSATGGFITEVRRGGQFREIGKSQNLGGAFEIGKKKVLTTLAASFRVRKAGTDEFVKLPTTQEFRLGKKKDAFVLIQKKGGKEGGLPGGRLSTTGEKREIQFIKRRMKK